MRWYTFLFALIAPVFSAPLSSRTTTTNRALWLWNTDLITNNAKVTKFLSVATSPTYKITTVYALSGCDIDTSRWRSFITKCTAAGITVHALLGDPNWIVGSTVADGETLARSLDWIEGYQKNVSANARFTGIHMDVEPWALAGWATQKTAYISSYVSIIKTAATRAAALGLPFAADLPYWASIVPCQSTTLDKCLLPYLDSVTFLTYRNTALDLFNLAKPVLKAVGSAAPGKPVWLSVETCSDCEDASLISYAGKSVATMMQDLATVEKKATQKYSGFAGIAIDSYEFFSAMEA